MPDSETYEASVKVRDLPKHVDVMLGQIAAIRSKFKWEIIREALEEFVENHKNEIEASLRR